MKERESLYTACGAFLEWLPECAVTPEALARSLNDFEIDSRTVRESARLLPKHYDLNFRGVRLLIGVCLEQFVAMTENDVCRRCEVTVPSPTFLTMALSRAAEGRIRFSTDALIAQIVLRSFFLSRRPVENVGCAMARCGLNLMRSALAERGYCRDGMLSFGVLCDECVKTSEGISLPGCTVVYPKAVSPAWTVERTQRFVDDVCESLGVTLTDRHRLGAMGEYGRLVQLEDRLLRSQIDAGFPLNGNSLTLAQTMQLMVFSDWSPVLHALELLCRELKSAVRVPPSVRVYCFYLPFLYPELDGLFREQGVSLTGNAVFLTQPKTDIPSGMNLEVMTAQWLNSMTVRAGTKETCAAIARAIHEQGCCAYLTGMFAFDRWMGQNTALCREILWREAGIPTHILNLDFWCERPGDVLTQVESLSALFTGK